jgi:dTDP-L-rhamnose 4-epimerase
LIGSHLADLLIKEGWPVRILDNLEARTHPLGRPSWIPEAAEFCETDVCDAAGIAAALRGIDVVFHQAAYGGFVPEIAKYIRVNSLGTAQMLEIIRDENFPVRKVVVASSQAVYGEGAAVCPAHGMVFPPLRGAAQLGAGDFGVYCPVCGAETGPVPTPESAHMGGETPYAISKMDQERLTLSWGRQTGIPTVALRYAVTYGPRQSIYNPYTGVIAIFCTRLLNGLPPVVYEDGEQTRDFIYVEDVARANLLAATTTALDGLAVNVGTSKSTSIRRLAELVADALGRRTGPVMRGEFRPGEVRHLSSDTSRLSAAGHAAEVDLEAGVARYISWIRSQGDVREYFTAAEAALRTKGVIRPVATLPPVAGEI